MLVNVIIWRELAHAHPVLGGFQIPWYQTWRGVIQSCKLMNKKPFCAKHYLQELVLLFRQRDTSVVHGPSKPDKSGVYIQKYTVISIANIYGDQQYFFGRPFSTMPTLAFVFCLHIHISEASPA